MQFSVLASTAFLTLLLAIGLFFFIRAATKDRTEVVQLVSDRPEEALLEQIQQYFSQRAYRIVGVDAATNQVTFEGFVRPSVFLTIFLTLLAAIGIGCLLLVLSLLFPDTGQALAIPLLLAPAAGAFYWKKAGRSEKVSLQVAALVDESQASQRLLTVTAHRDELAELQRSLNLQAFVE